MSLSVKFKCVVSSFCNFARGIKAQLKQYSVTK